MSPPWFAFIVDPFYTLEMGMSRIISRSGHFFLQKKIDIFYRRVIQGFPMIKQSDKFRSWIAKSGLKNKFVAAKLGISETMMSRLLAGTYTPSTQLQRRIDRFTDGAISKGWK